MEQCNVRVKGRQFVELPESGAKGGSSNEVVPPLFNSTKIIKGIFCMMQNMDKFEHIIGIDPEKRLGERVGNYRIIRWLGRGAFADVYHGLAEGSLLGSAK